MPAHEQRTGANRHGHGAVTTMLRTLGSLLKRWFPARRKGDESLARFVQSAQRNNAMNPLTLKPIDGTSSRPPACPFTPDAFSSPQSHLLLLQASPLLLRHLFKPSGLLTHLFRLIHKTLGKR